MHLRFVVVASVVILGLLATPGCAMAAPASPPSNSPATNSPAPNSPAPNSPASNSPAPAPPGSPVLRQLDALVVKGRAPKTGYTRTQFGQAWSDDVTVGGGHNGCDTRNDILRRDLTAITVKPGSNGCAVATGTLADPYTRTTIAFTRGSSSSSAVQIDHVVALSDAWQKGAQQLSAEQRRNFANDPRNLQATDGPTNQKKGDGDAATWLVPNTSYRCTYVSRQIDVKALYNLWVTQAEKDAMTRVLTSCGATPPPTSTATPAPRPAPTSTPAPVYVAPPTREYVPAPDPAYTPPAPAVDDGSAYYANCAAARAAGAAPLYQGQPGYRLKLDRDGDGVACE